MGIVTGTVNNHRRMTHIHESCDTVHICDIHIQIRCQNIVFHTVKSITDRTAKSSIGTDNPNLCFTHKHPPFIISHTKC